MARILVIDDEEIIRRVLRQALEISGYDVDEAPNGEEGLDRYRQAPADLIITDILMPEKEGLETIMELRREAPEAKIIAISGGGQSGLDFLQVAERLGAKRAFQKPFRMHEILAAVQEVLEGAN